jgi:TetR/AcrR family tetracycline transcriptional repressor
VVAAGARLLDEEGVGGLSMRRLAGILGTGPATLYWHVRDKDELLGLILEDTSRSIGIPSEGGWDERLAALLLEARKALLPRPALIGVLWGTGWEDLGPETLRVADAMVGLVAESGLPEREVADAYFAVLVFLYGFVWGEAMSAGNRAYGNERASHPAEYLNLTKYGPGADPGGMDRRFRNGVSRLIGGIRARVAEAAAPDGPATAPGVPPRST